MVTVTGGSAESERNDREERREQEVLLLFLLISSLSPFWRGGRWEEGMWVGHPWFIPSSLFYSVYEEKGRKEGEGSPAALSSFSSGQLSQDSSNQLSQNSSTHLF